MSEKETAGFKIGNKKIMYLQVVQVNVIKMDGNVIEWCCILQKTEEKYGRSRRKIYCKQ